MSVGSPETLPLLCELGWHRAEKLARWNDGYYFSKCARCGQDLVRTAYGSWQVPKGYRVVWQQKPPESRQDIALVPADGGNGENGHANGTHARSEQPSSSESIAPVAAVPVEGEHAEVPEPVAPQPEPEVARAAERQPEPVEAVEPEPQPDERPGPETVEAPQPLRASEPEPVQTAEPEPIHVPEPEPARVPEPVAAAAPEIGEEEPAPTAGSVAAEPVAAELAHSPVDTALEPGVSRAQHLFQELPREFSNISEPIPVEADAPAPSPDDEPLLPMDALREQAPAEPAAEAAPEPVAETLPPPSNRNELPIAEVLRHLHSTPLPPTPPEEPAVEEVAGEAPEPEAAVVQESEPEPEPEVAVEALPDHLPIQEVEPVAEVAAEPVAGEVGEVEEPQEAVAEEPPVEEPPYDEFRVESQPIAGFPEREKPLAPIRPVSPDWDFMAEDEPDPIGSFWEETAPAPEPEPVAATDPLSDDETQPATECAAEAPAPLHEQQPEPTFAAVEPEPTIAAAEPEPSFAAAEPEPTPAFTPLESPVEVTDWREAVAITPAAPVAVAPFEFAHFDEPARTEPADDTIPSFRMSAPPPPEARLEPDSDDVPPWVDASDASEEEEQHKAKRSSHFALAAVASLAVVAAVVAVSNRPAGAPNASPQPSPMAAATQQPSPPPAPTVSPAPAPSAAPKETVRAEPPPPLVRRPAEEARSREDETPARPPFVSPGRPALMGPMPRLAGRETAFVSASVLQCRSAPVERSPAVRKLVRGAEVQVLAREGRWVSVAHKGRQCWAADRFLSTVQPW